MVRDRDLAGQCEAAWGRSARVDLCYFMNKNTLEKSVEGECLFCFPFEMALRFIAVLWRKFTFFPEQFNQFVRMSDEKQVKEEKVEECYHPYVYHYPDHCHPEQHTNYWNYTLGTFQGYGRMPNFIPYCPYFYPANQQETECRHFSHPEQVTHQSHPAQSSQVKVEWVQERASAEGVQHEPVMVERWGQKFGRNILSNIFHMAIKKIASREFSELTARVIDAYRMTIKETQFRAKLEEKGKQTNGYINVRNIKRLVVGNPIGATRHDIEFRRLLRILIRNYLHYHHVPHIYHSGKIKRQSRALHMEAVRKLAQKLARN